MPGNKLTAIARSPDFKARCLLLLHANLDRPLAIRENVLQILRLRPAVAIDTVEALSITAGVIVDLQLIVAADAELVGHFSCGNAVDGFSLGLEVLVRELKAMVPKRVLA